MKNFLLFSFIFLIGYGAYSQKQGITIKEAQKIMKTAIYHAPNDIVVNSNKAQSSNTDVTLVDPAETNIGNTFYDLQSNTLLQNRIYRYDDGSIGAVWTQGSESPPSFPDRGTGYNFFDGTAWGAAPQSRLESVRAGWPSYAPLGLNGEIVVSHDFGALELFILTREEKGVGDWTQTMYTGTPGPGQLAWGRVTTAGTDRNTIHLLANTYEEYLGQTTAIVYSRSLDAGQTWDIQNVVLDGTGEDYYTEINADEYIWADTRNGYIAFLCADVWHDMFMMKSDDNGETWEKTVIWEHPYPFFDWNTTITDTFFCCDNSASIALDESGKAHVVFGISRVGHFEVGTTYNYWPGCDGIGYWNEDMDEFSNDIHALSPPEWGYSNTEMEEDYNLIGWTQDVDGDGVVTLAADIMAYRELGLSTMPTITIDENGYIFVLYASTTETFVYMDYNYKHVWARAGYNGEWAEFHDMTSSIFHLVDECIYPQLASNTDDNIHYFYQLDQIPGLALDEDHEYVDNTEVYGTIAKSELIEYNPSNTQTIYVEPGFQFASSRILPDNADMMEVAAGIINDDLEYIRNSTGAMVRKIGPNWVNGIGDWIGTEGYLIKTNGTGEFTVSGSVIPAGTTINLMAGFQFVSFLPEMPMDALEAFASILGDDLVYVRNSSGNMVRKIGPNWVNGIGDCIPTEGYLIKMNADAELVYPAKAKSSGLTKVEPYHLIFEGGNAAEAVYTIYVDGLEIGDEIAAYNGNAILGSMTVISNNIFDNDLPIFSQLFNGQGYVAGEPISLKIWSNGNVVSANFEMKSVYNSYVSNVYPDNDGEFSVISITKGVTLIEELHIYPNPATDILNINSNTNVSNVKVLNYIGQTIDNINVTGMEVTINTSTYDAGIYFIQIETEKGISTQKIVIE